MMKAKLHEHLQEIKLNVRKAGVKYVLIVVLSIGCKKGNHYGGSDQPDKKAIVSTIAGDGTDAVVNGPALSAAFSTPADVAVAPDGTIYVVDYNDHRVRKIAGGQVSTLAGSDSTGIVNGHGGAARFKDPYRIATDPAGNCYVIDEVDPRIRKITPNGDVTTYAGTNAPGFANGPALSAQFLINAEGLASDEHGNIYVGDTFNGRIRAVSQAAQVTTAAGDGAEGFRNGDKGTAEFRYPGAVTCDQQNNIYVMDAGNLVIRKITPGGVVSTFAGSGVRGTADGDATTAQFDQPLDLVADAQGNIYVIDDQRIRKVTTQGKVSTVAGGVKGYADGDGADAKFNTPFGLGIDAQGNVYVADANNNRIRKITFQ
ncbi:NHL repeat-containing protein [Flavitalea sp. BT771]|uniref:NHL repeat-containing protein n=1 Tax=Flavitalea sp. BT771 TaxID=3063329 RepID=UPI0026E3A8FF|nr:NHL repeat-containing protein [Flavitalea sp. BT771]MDO6432986.1 NHL repeat-containing protein [Flavitalea sp. BT771]MDV6221738.1 NHL repeat-containing protein [Flavitalea sp. BT771]